VKPPLRILHLEDDARDSELLRAMLEMEDLPAELYRVGTREQFARALDAALREPAQASDLPEAQTLGVVS